MSLIFSSVKYRQIFLFASYNFCNTDSMMMFKCFRYHWQMGESLTKKNKNCPFLLQQQTNYSHVLDGNIIMHFFLSDFLLFFNCLRLPITVAPKPAREKNTTHYCRGSKGELHMCWSWPLATFFKKQKEGKKSDIGKKGVNVLKKLNFDSGVVMIKSFLG